jgi:CheY-like chemotaxis protein
MHDRPASGDPGVEERALRVIVVDDNRDAAESMAMLLEMRGHRVVTAGDGLAALRIAETFTPDVVILDLIMPRMDGYETARRMRALPSLRDVVLVAVTAWGNLDDEATSLETGFDLHLRKPIDLARLEQVLGARRVGPRRARDPAET